ncbi:MAG: hypothetical protein IPP19_09485 [Verrucomicrobia bacterium]|nr:hypothetical protein [Verrucomicrobiota bacterium]
MKFAFWTSFIIFLSSCVCAEEIIVEPRVGQIAAHRINGTNIYEVEFSVELHVVNTSNNTLKVITSGLGPYLVTKANSLSVVYIYEPEVLPNGKVRIPSENAFDVVVLKPGEATVVASPKPVRGRTDSGNISIEYSIPEFLKQRFGVWAGRISMKGKVRLFDDP